MINSNDEMNTVTSKTERSNSATHFCKTSRRPKTPHINLFSEEEVQVRTIRKKNDSEDPQNLIKNFSAFMKGIIESQNENFLSGDTKVIGFIISKYLKMDLEDIRKLQKLSIKINSDFGLLNSFGEYLPNLRELKLKDSQISSISECGTSFKNLKILNVTNCGLKDLSGINLII
jgi:Leucine-rich repeat (LRR) protein